MARTGISVLVLAIAAFGASASLRGIGEGKEKKETPKPPPDLTNVNLNSGPLTSFETGCYMEKNPLLEEGGSNGKSYRGLVTSTVSGRVCQNWLSKHPHEIKETIKVVADEEVPVDPEAPDEGMKMTWGTGIGNHNYCRNPDSSKTKPWCYTLDPSPEHMIEECDIPKCGNRTDWTAKADDLKTEIEASPDCGCSDQLFGSTKTTKDTAVPLSELQKKPAKKTTALVMQRAWLDFRAGHPHRHFATIHEHHCNCGHVHRK